MNKFKISGIVVVLALIAGLGFRFIGSKGEPEFKVLTPTVGELIVKVASNGFVAPKNRVVVTTPIAGRVDSVLVEEGAKVKKGQKVALLSSGDRVALMDSLNQGRDREDMEKLLDMYLQTPILSPVTGTVVLRSVNQGQSVNSNATLFEVSDVLIVVSKIDETDIAKIYSKQKVTIRIDAYGNDVFEGYVERISQQSTITNSVTTYDVFVEIPAIFPDKIKSGMSASIDYVISQKSDAMLLPSWLSEGRKNSSFDILVQGANGKPEPRTIVLGESNGEFVEVTSGMKMTDKILYKPMNFDMKSSGGLPFSVGNKRK